MSYSRNFGPAVRAAGMRWPTCFDTGSEGVESANKQLCSPSYTQINKVDTWYTCFQENRQGYSTGHECLNFYGAQESISRNEFRQPMLPGGPMYDNLFLLGSYSPHRLFKNSSSRYAHVTQKHSKYPPALRLPSTDTHQRRIMKIWDYILVNILRLALLLPR